MRRHCARKHDDQTLSRDCSLVARFQLLIAQLFLRGKPHLQKYMRRLPKTHKKLPMKREEEPNFYEMDKTSPLPEIQEVRINASMLPMRRQHSAVAVAAASAPLNASLNPSMSRLPYPPAPGYFNNPLARKDAYEAAVASAPMTSSFAASLSRNPMHPPLPLPYDPYPASPSSQYYQYQRMRHLQHLQLFQRQIGSPPQPGSDEYARLQAEAALGFRPRPPL